MTRLLAVIATLAIAMPTAHAAEGRIDLDGDRARAEVAASIVSADQNYLVMQVHRVHMLNASWQYEIARGHTTEAGMLAVEHFKALQDERHARFVLEHASADYVDAKERLVVDEFTLQRTV
jgi:hypothetical protein